jgi:hypothetical protein
VAKPVTDPALLAALEAPESAPQGKPVTDPALLAQLEGGDTKAAPAEDAYSRVAGLAKATGTGIAKGVIGAAGFVPWVSDIAHAGANKFLFDPVFNAISGPPKSTKSLGDLVTGADGRQPININEIASPQSIQKGIESVAGEFHKPQNTEEQYAETIGSFLPSVAAGPGSIGTRLVMQALLPGAASETAGQLTKGSAAEPYARLGAAVLSPFAAGGGIRSVQKLYEPAVGVNGYGANHLVRAMQADTPAAVRSELNRLGPEATLADAGPAFLGKAQGASLNSDEGRSILFGAMKARDQGTNSRIMGDVDRALGPAEDPQTVTNAILAHRHEVDNVAYPAALDTAPPVRTGRIMQDLEDFIPHAVGQRKSRVENLREMMTRYENRARIDPYHRAAGNRRPRQDGVGPRAGCQDEAHVLHKVKGELDNVIEHDAAWPRRAGGGADAAAIRAEADAARAQPDAREQVPGYAAANRASAALARRADAVKTGTQYLGEGKTTPSPSRFLDEFEQLEAGERIALGKGSRGEIDRKLGTKANDLQALRIGAAGRGRLEHGEDGDRARR